MHVRTTFIIIVLLVLAVGVVAWGDDRRSWELADINELVLDGLSGDVVIRAAESGAGVIKLDARVRPSDAFEADADESDGRLRIKERWYESSHGDVRWTIYLPKRNNIALDISNASGGLECRDVAARINFESASGDIDLTAVELGEDSDFRTASGSFSIADMSVSPDARFRTASGDIDLENVKIADDCEFSSASGDINVSGSEIGDDVEMSSASGDVSVRDVKLKGEARFGSASGDVSVRMDGLPEKDFTASSASGRVTLELAKWGRNFTLVMIKREDRGDISCPFEYTEETEFEEHYQVYEKKVVKRGSGGPTITLRTASGRVVVRD